MTAHKLDGKPLEQVAPFTKQRQEEKDALLQAEREQIEDAAAARIQLGLILYELPELSFTKDQEPDGESWGTAPTGNRWRDSLTDAQILERQYKTAQMVPGYSLADFARDQVGIIERLLEPIRTYYGPQDYDLQRGTQYKNYLQEYTPASGPAKPRGKGGRPKYDQTLSALLIEDGATQERAAQIVKTAKKWAEKKGAPGLACVLLAAQEAGDLKEHTPGKLWAAADLEGAAPKTTRRNFQTVLQGGAASIDDATRKQIKTELQQ